MSWLNKYLGGIKISAWLWWGEENGENAPASWNTSLEDSLDGFMKKAKPRPKWKGSGGVSGVDA
ncbi:hypothetical protein ADS79_01915 [Brevibacillus reuszeri]|uniref:Uncharacterized protein n=1 Tax=Brevibacillus reuszeri TaxID=54915 RepID=A0A0K9Z0M4_9BACL|nr:hypothetical protein ADS79_01915 [Brevibacillus reuszeri]